MKAFLKTYWLEFLFFAVGLVGAVIAMPFLPASVPLQFQGDGVITRTGPKWAVFIIPVVQLLVLWLPLVDKPLPGEAPRPGPHPRGHGEPAACGAVHHPSDVGAVRAVGRLGRDNPPGRGAAGGAAAGAHCVHRLCGRENPGQHRQTEITAGRLGGCSHRRGRAVR